MKSQRIVIPTISVLAFGFASIAATQQQYPPTDLIKADLAKKDYVQLRVDIGVGAPGALDRIRAILIARKIARSFSTKAIAQMGESASESIQNGGNALSSASTSVISKSLSSVLGIAEESGAISSSTSGTTTTLTANIPQIANYLVPGSSRCYIISDHCALTSLLIRGASASVSLNSTTKSSTPSLSDLSATALAGLTGVQNPTFNNFTFQESLHGRKRQGTSQTAFQNALEKIPDAKKSALLTGYLNALDPITDPSKGSPALVSQYNSALTTCVTNIKNASNDDRSIEQAEGDCVNSFVDIVQSIPGVDDKLTQSTQAEQAYNVARDAALTALFYNSTFSLEYDLTNNANQPMVSTFKGVYGYQHQFKKGLLQTTANGSMTMYNSLEGSTESRARSAQGALQFDYEPDSSLKIQPAFSLGYYFQYMNANGLINLPSTDFAPGTTIPLSSSASVLLNTTGPIHIDQGKVTLSIKGTNINIPIAITGASRTDLVKANRVSGNFGICYDFSSLFSR
jgi:hypothetical protein